jgi:uncharacterized membrane protein
MLKQVRRYPGRLVAALAFASLCCAAMVEIRAHHTGRSYYRFMDWNLFLAWIPFLLALVTQRAAGEGGRASVPMLSLLWLLFFPNAPYVVTDFVHLGQSPYMPLWFDGLLLSAFSWTGLLLGFLSLHLMHGVWRRVYGVVVCRVSVLASLALSSVAIYLGRFFRLNSWDAFLHPVTVVELALKPVLSPPTAAALVLLTGALVAGYAGLFALLGEPGRGYERSGE